MHEQESETTSPLRLTGKRLRWLSALLLASCLLAGGLISWYSLSHARAASTPVTRSAATNPVSFLRETYEGATIHISAYSAANGKVLWMTSRQYGHTDYLQRSNGLSYFLDGNIVYYVSKCRLFAVHALDGRSIWEQDLWQAGQTLCSYGNVLVDKALDHLYLVGTVSSEAIREIPVEPGEMPSRYLPTTSDPRLLAFHKSTGALLWRNTTVGSAVFEGMFISQGPFAVDQGLIYTTESPFAETADERKLIALSGNSGDLLWKDSRPREEVMSLTASGGRVFVQTAQLSEDREHFTRVTLASLRGSVGSLVWSQTLTTDTPDTLLIARGSVFVRSFLQNLEAGTTHVYLYGYNLQTGQKSAAFDAGVINGSVPPGAGFAATLYLVSDNGVVRAIQPETGVVLWTSASFGATSADLHVVDNALVFLSRTEKRETYVISLDLLTGKTRWQQLLD